MTSSVQPMSPPESQQYDLGRQARRAKFETSACNLAVLNRLRAFWLAGWHDEDFERGVRVYKPQPKESMQ